MAHDVVTSASASNGNGSASVKHRATKGGSAANGAADTTPAPEPSNGKKDDFGFQPDVAGVTHGNKGTWGRAYGTWWSTLFCGMLLFGAPPFATYVWMACDSYDCSIAGPAMDLMNGTSLVQLLKTHGPRPTWPGVQLYAAWLAFQIALAVWLPGPTAYGSPTPAGHVLGYRVNGLRVWVLTHVLFYICTAKLGLFKASIIADNWGALFICTNVYGFLLAAVVYAKALLHPSHPDDCKFSGSRIYDLFMGVELNPRVGNLDLKLFHNGRPGITAWTLINWSFAAAQYERLGYVTSSMVLLNVLQAIYVVDFFANEDWYLRTMDICHDHFGFYLAWGDPVWLPFLYTLQAQYLHRHPVELSPAALCAIAALGFGGYAVFRSANAQKDYFRDAMRRDGRCTIWGRPARYVEAPYATADGKTKTNLLLASGWWGISRHFNYVGDLMGSLAYCLTCGSGHILPYFYIIYMAILLGHRCLRDNQRCRAKYGAAWDEYTRLVPYNILPYIW